MIDYRAIFEAFETSLLRHSTLPEAELREELAAFKIDSSTIFSEDDYYEKLLIAIFYAGMRAQTVTDRWPTIKSYFPDWQTVVSYTQTDIDRMFADPTMLRNRNKINAAVKNARVFQDIARRHGSFSNYLETFEPYDDFRNVISLKDEMQYRFAGLGPITTYHFMTDIGLPVLKPDRVIRRIFKRLGIIEDEGQLLETVKQGREFAAATGLPIRYIDIVFVVYGQAANIEWGLPRGICLGANPSCRVCDARIYCNYFRDSKQN